MISDCSLFCKEVNESLEEGKKVIEIFYFMTFATVAPFDGNVIIC